MQQCRHLEQRFNEVRIDTYHELQNITDKIKFDGWDEDETQKSS